MAFLDSLSFAAGITAPILLVLLLGAFLKRINHISDDFVGSASKLCFNIAMPALLAASIYHADFSANNGLPLVIYGFIATAICYLLLELTIPLITGKKPETGVVIQAAFRSNMGIMGLAYCANAYGETAYPIAALYIAVNTMIYNVFSVITLTRWHTSGLALSSLLKQIVIGIVKNPIVMSIAFALLLKLLSIDVPKAMVQSIDYLAQLALPLALLCAGASLNFKRNTDTLNLCLASGLRLAVVPTLITIGGYLFGFKGMDLGILFLLVSAPAAAASYVMVRAMNGNSALAANIIALTTIASIFTTGIGAAVLSSLNWT